MLGELLLVYAALAVLVGNGLLTAFVVLGHSREAAGAFKPIATSPLAIVRPLRGIHPTAGKANQALLNQRYRGELRWFFVATHGTDPGLERARRDYGSEERVRCLTSEPRADATDKASNMIRAWHASSAPFVAFCDADIELAPDAAQVAMNAFEDPCVAAVFAPVLYRPRSVLERIAALIVSGDKLVTVSALDRVGLLSVMEGGFMVVRRSALAKVGPIEEVLSRTVADDLRLATALTDHGFRIRVSRPVIHLQRSASVAAWLLQYHRWMVCVRSERLSVLMLQLALHPVAVPLLAALAEPTRTIAPALLLSSIAWRVILSLSADRLALRAERVGIGWWCLARPIADLLHFGVGVASLIWPRVHWAGRRYDFRAGTAAASTARKARAA